VISKLNVYSIEHIIGVLAMTKACV